MRAALFLALALAAAPARAADTCVECHAKLDRAELSSPVGAVRGDVHGKGNVSCTGCHGGDASASHGNEAHGRGFVARPKGKQAAEICGRCHSQVLQSWEKSPHAKTAQAARRADCATCHGAHGVKRASLAIIGEPLCSSCHAFAAPEKFLRALIVPERELASVKTLVARGPDGDLAARVDAARSRLRGHSHTLDLYAVTREAARALAERDAVAAAAQARRPGPGWSAVGLGAALAAAALLFVVAGVWLGGFLVRRIRARIGRRFPAAPWAGALLVSVLVAVVAIAAIAGWRGYDYLENDPRFCTSCHLMEEAYTAWQQSAHKDVTCHSCHANNARANLEQLWVFLTEAPGEVVKHAVVDRNACERCHNSAKSPAKWNQIAVTAGHKLHAGKQRVECVQCHAPSVHRFRPTETLCASCHRDVTLASAGGMSEMHCTSCHRFLAEGSKSLRPERTACLECHAEAGGQPVPAGHAKVALYKVGSKDAPMAWECSECHKPHRQLKMTPAECAQCHESEIASKVHQVDAHSDCTGCHAPHGWMPPGGCLECHDEVPQVP